VSKVDSIPFGVERVEGIGTPLYAENNSITAVFGILLCLLNGIVE
jgi:hypothetical protein